MKLVTSAEMQTAEQAAESDRLSYAAMIESAGTALAQAVTELAPTGPVLILVGPGNNGSDGSAVAKQLLTTGRDVAVYDTNRNGREPANASTHLVAGEDPDQSRLRELLATASVVVDALLGIGMSRAPEGVLATIINTVNQRENRDAHVIAADIPTGVNADTGAVPTVAIQANVTICMGAAKRGVFQYPGAGNAGAVRVASVGISETLFDSVQVRSMEPAEAQSLIPTRGENGSKGSSGSVLFVGGSSDFCGAPVMASMGAYRAGAGLVQVAVPRSIKNVVASHSVEPIYLSLPEEDGFIARDASVEVSKALQRARSMVFGCGMGQSASTQEFVRRMLGVLHLTQIPAVIDADALNALSQIDAWWGPHLNAVITPHPGEMSRLTGLTIPDIQGNRIAVARTHAQHWGVIVVLKGAGTVVAHPDGRATVNTTGGPNLATAGTGDVLSGVIGGLLAQGCDPYDAARLGVYLHGLAGDLVRQTLGDAGTIASDLLTHIPLARQQILLGTKGTV